MPSEAREPAARPVPDWVRWLVRMMDDALPVPGTRFRIGADAIAGFLLPGAGDALGVLSHVVLLVTAFRLRAPRVVFVRMVLNAAADVLTGSVPVLGDLFDAAFKANRKNLALLERATTGEARAARLGDYLVVGAALASLLLLMLLPLLLLTLAAHWLLTRH